MTARTLGYLTFVSLSIWGFLRYLMPYLFPFVFAVFLAFTLEPAVQFLTNKLRFRRSHASLLMILIIVTLLLTFLAWGVTRIASELTDLYGYLPQYYTNFNEVLSYILKTAGDISERLPEPLARGAQEQWNRLYSLVARLVSGAGGLVRGLPSFAVTALFAILATYFVMRDRAPISAFIRHIVSPKALQGFQHVETGILLGLGGLVRAWALLALLTMIINVLGLMLLGIRYAVALGILLAVLDILPILGPGLIYVPWVLYHFIWGNVGTAIGLVVLYGSVSLLRQVFQTHLMGRELGLHPLATLISVYVGFRLFGTAGIVYGPLSILVIKILWESGFIPHEGGDTD